MPSLRTDHETKVGAAHLEPLSRRSSSDHL